MEVFTVMPPPAPVPPSPSRTRKHPGGKHSIDAAEALRHWGALSLEARQELLCFRERSIVDTAFRIQEALKKFEQDCMSKGITFRNHEGQTVLSLGLASFGFSPEATGQAGQPAPEIFFAHGPLMGKDEQHFIEYMEYRLGGFLTGCRPVIRQDQWTNLFEPAPNSWVEFESQALRLVEQAILRFFLDAVAASAAAGTPKAKTQHDDNDWIALAEELEESSSPASPGKKARRKAARRKVRLAAASGDSPEEGEKSSDGAHQQEKKTNPKKPQPKPKETTSQDEKHKEEDTLEDDVEDDVDKASSSTRSTLGANMDAWSTVSSRTARRKDRKVGDSHPCHRRTASGASTLAESVTETACGSSCGVKSNISESISDGVPEDISEMDAPSEKAMPATPPSTLDYNTWITNGRLGEAAEWHLCFSSDTDGREERLNSICGYRESVDCAYPDLPTYATYAGFRAVVKKTFIDIEVECKEDVQNTRCRSWSAN
jgi:hypothetical protein